MRIRTRVPAALVPLLMFTAEVAAEETELRCRLYMSTATESLSSHESAEAQTVLNAIRRGGVCVFADGSVADKQFVALQNVSNGGATGLSTGYSVYTFENGDTLTMSFEGGWDEDGFAADYTVLSGTGAYRDAGGTGRIAGVPSPWRGTGIVDIEIDVTMAGN